MSYDIKLSKVCDNKVIWDDHIVENDFKTVILGVPLSSSNVVVRINDFKRSKEQQTELLLREDVSAQVSTSNRTFFVTQGPIYSGLKAGKLATRPEEIIVRLKVTEEDVSKQFTGVEDYFFTQARPLMKSNNYDFNGFVDVKDIEVKINGIVLTDDKIKDIDSKAGRIQLKQIPTVNDIVLITYFFRAKIKEFDALQARVVIKELPKLGQEVKIAYYSKQNDGWSIENSKRALITRAQDIVFDRNRNTNRFFIEKENVSNQFTGIEKQFFTMYSPVLPLYQMFESTLDNTLNNAVVVYLNGDRIPVAGIVPDTGKVILYQRPQTGDIVEVSYYYETELEPDRISVDYYVDSVYCDKCSKQTDLLDYSIDKLGQYEKVFDESKLIQDLKKIVRTILGSDPVATWYGTNFESIVGTKAFPDITKTKITDELVTALSKLKSAQIQQEEYQKVTDNEFLDTVMKVDVQQSVSDPSLYTVDVDVSTQSGRLVSVKEVIQTKG
jgi:hypothetical protein